MIQIICAECGRAERFETKEAAIGADWQRLKFGGPVEREDWFCPTEPRSVVDAKLEARIAEGLAGVRDGRIRE